MIYSKFDAGCVLFVNGKGKGVQVARAKAKILKPLVGDNQGMIFRDFTLVYGDTEPPEVLALKKRYAVPSNNILTFTPERFVDAMNWLEEE